MLDHTFCVAPMMDWTDRHDRVFLRQFSRCALLYTEMVTAAALKHGDASYLLQYNAQEHPLALQLGGSDPVELAAGAKLGESAGFDEINLNVGCPSDRVQSGAFGACLMADPPLVGRCVASMKSAVSTPITVKCRIGIDDRDSQAELEDFVGVVAEAGCELFVIHARKAWLSGLSPKQNREIPALDYKRVFSIKKTFPQLQIIINGGITSLDQAVKLLENTDGVMLGREAYQNPFVMHEVDNRLFAQPTASKTRIDYLLGYLPYIEQQLDKGVPLQHMTRHILGLFRGQRGGKQYRKHLSENSRLPGAGLSVLHGAIAYVN